MKQIHLNVPKSRTDHRLPSLEDGLKSNTHNVVSVSNLASY